MNTVPPFSTDDVLRILFDRCLREGSQKLWAERHKISPAYVSDVLRGNREPGDSILKALQLRKVVTYDYAEAVERQVSEPVANVKLRKNKA